MGRDGFSSLLMDLGTLYKTALQRPALGHRCHPGPTCRGPSWPHPLPSLLLRASPDELLKGFLLFAQSREVALLLRGASVDQKVNPAREDRTPLGCDSPRSCPLLSAPVLQGSARPWEVRMLEAVHMHGSSGHICCSQPTCRRSHYQYQRLINTKM